jgi:hypothetical protein
MSGRSDGRRWFLPALIAGLFFSWEAADLCFASDVRATCCPAACAAKHGRQWPKADEILRGCMRGLGCNDATVEGATVGMRCDCSVQP